MKSITTQLAFAARIALAVLALAAVLLLVGRDLYDLISPAWFLLCAAAGVGCWCSRCRCRVSAGCSAG